MEKIKILQVFFLFVFTFLFVSEANAETITINPAPNSELGCQTTDAGCYTPNDVTINIGDSIEFENTDSIPHSFTSGNIENGPDGVFDSDVMYGKSHFTWIPQTTGVFEYFCIVHPWMSAQITVISKESDPIRTNITEDNTLSVLEIPAKFVDLTQDPQNYVDRYYNEPKYKKWFDENYPQYTSIYQAVGSDEPQKFEESKLSQDCPDGEEWIESAEICMTPMPEMDEDPANVPTCGKGTILQDRICVIESKSENESKGGCLIATATYGTELAPQVQLLREIRDNKIMKTDSGMAFMGFFNAAYYTFSPQISDIEREIPIFKQMVHMTITPLILTLYLMDDVESEFDVMFYGIIVIITNIGLYIITPLIGILFIKKQLQGTEIRYTLK